MGSLVGYGFCGRKKFSVQVVDNDFHFVHMKKKFSQLDEWILFIGIYGSL